MPPHAQSPGPLVSRQNCPVRDVAGSPRQGCGTGWKEGRERSGRRGPDGVRGDLTRCATLRGAGGEVGGPCAKVEEAESAKEFEVIQTRETRCKWPE